MVTKTPPLWGKETTKTEINEGCFRKAIKDEVSYVAKTIKN